MEKNDNIKIIPGNGKDLDISPVYDHIDIEKPKEKDKKKSIIIPNDKNTKKNHKK